MTENLFDKSLTKINLMFRCSGTNIAIGEAIPTNTKKNRFIYILNFIWLNTDVIGAVCWFITNLNRGENFTELTYVAPCVTLSFLCDIKSLFIIIYEKKMYKLMGKLRAMEVKERQREKSTERIEIIEKGVNFLNLVVNVLYVLNILLLVSFALHPLVLMGLYYKKTNQIKLLLPFLIVYPFDAYNIKVWPIVYVRQIWSDSRWMLAISNMTSTAKQRTPQRFTYRLVGTACIYRLPNVQKIVVVINICVADFLFYNFCSYITIQFRLLRYDIENLITKTRHYEDSRDIENKLIEIIKWHQELITCVNLLETIYALSTLYNFVSSSIIICLTGFNVTENTDMILVITFLTFLFMGLLQIFFLCFFGDMLIDATIDVSNAVYNSKWYLASPSMRKSLLLIQSRAQIPCKLTAFGFAEVSLRAFMKILSTSWSYFALLKTLYSSE